MRVASALRTERYAASMGTIDARLAEGHAAGRAAWPPVELSCARYATRAFEVTARRPALAGHAPGSPAHADAVARAALTDLYLSLACDDLTEHAWPVLVARFTRPLRAVASRMRRTDAEEAACELLDDLATPGPDGSRTRLGGFDGRGSLLGWLTAILVRRVWKSGRRSDSRLAVSLDAGEGVQGPHGSDRAGQDSDGADPAERVADAETAAVLDRAFARAWDDLTSRERLALLLKHRDGRTQREVAATLGVGEPRVSRLVGAAVEKLRGGVIAALPSAGGDGLRDRALALLAARIAVRLARTPLERPPSKGSTSP